jgi:hypothetical protein
MSVRRIHVVFKTHLDIGFTALAADVVEQYFTCFIPRAIELARQTRGSDDGRFLWTTGSWLIHEYLEKSSASARKAMEEAILAGDITWHALPFTTHTELADSSLFRHGLSLSQRLDARFGRKTVAAKMTDVPGHTRALVPLLAEAGVKFLHIGVNGACRPPSVPPAFIWRHDDGSEIFVMYDASYGGTRTLPGVSAALAIAHTNDNHGPQGREEIWRTFDDLRKSFPNAEVVGSTMDAFVSELVASAPSLPVVTQEIGDTWIHGVGTDPIKVAKFKALSRWRRHIEETRPSFAAISAFHRMGTELLLVAEHTWGRDIKRWRTTDGKWEAYVEESYDTAEFLCQRSLGTYDDYEASWLEQRDYLERAVAALDHTALGGEARSVLEDAGRIHPEAAGFTTIPAGALMTLGAWEVAVDPQNGALSTLKETKSGFDWAGPDHGLGCFQYQIFGGEDYERFYRRQYGRDFPATSGWALPDLTKPGMERVQPRGRSWEARLACIKRRSMPDAEELRLELGWDAEAVEHYGAPAKITVDLRFMWNSPHIEFSVSLVRKQACRIAEALWFGFHPSGISTETTRLVKMGQPIAPGGVVSGGARTLHACESVTCAKPAGETLRLDLLSAPLVAPGRPSLLDFHDEIPNVARDGFSVNLFNNVWGTNFPMWHDEDVRFDFLLVPERAHAPNAGPTA